MIGAHKTHSCVYSNRTATAYSCVCTYKLRMHHHKTCSHILIDKCVCAVFSVRTKTLAASTYAKPKNPYTNAMAKVYSVHITFACTHTVYGSLCLHANNTNNMRDA